MVKIRVLKADITRIRVDVIVNAANPGLLGGSGVDGAIHRAGGRAIMAECDQIRRKQGGCLTGGAVITTAGNLPAVYVIHTVGPIWNEDKNNESELLNQCYQSCLRLADKQSDDKRMIQSISFPNISTGVYGFPKHNAAMIAIDSVKNYFDTTSSTINQVNFVCFDDENYTIYQDLTSEAG